MFPELTKERRRPFHDWLVDRLPQNLSYEREKNHVDMINPENLSIRKTTVTKVLIQDGQIKVDEADFMVEYFRANSDEFIRTMIVDAWERLILPYEMVFYSEVPMSVKVAAVTDCVKWWINRQPGNLRPFYLDRLAKGDSTGSNREGFNYHFEWMVLFIKNRAPWKTVDTIIRCNSWGTRRWPTKKQKFRTRMALAPLVAQHIKAPIMEGS